MTRNQMKQHRERVRWALLLLVIFAAAAVMAVRL